MGLSGLWASRAGRDYTGATRWGTGVNPIHAVRDLGRGRVIGTRENLYPLGEPSDVVADSLAGRDLDWLCEDYADTAPPEGESFRYQEDRPRWDAQPPAFRDASNSPAMGEQPAWGVYFDSDPTDVFPLGGPTGGSQHWIDVDHGERVERQHAIAVPTRSVTGSWLVKERGAQAVPEGAQDLTQPGYQLAINTAAVQGQGLKEMANERAVARGTDDRRSPITSRTAGMVEKDYARSFGMGGGPGTPDMQPFQQTAGLKRPWLPRTAALPPAEAHFMNTLEARTPLARAMPPDPYQGDPEIGPGDAAASDWGF